MQNVQKINTSIAEIPLSERSERLHKITADFKDGFKDNLLVTQPIDSVSLARISTSLSYFLWVNLTEFWPDKEFDLVPDMLARYPEEISSLPNITPNGLILPKEENMHAYNALHKQIASYFCSLGLAEYVSSVHNPINIRLVDGNGDPQIDERPRASVKYHSDLWAAEPSNALMAFLCLAGDFDASSIEFVEPECFPIDLVRPLDDYLDGAHLADNARPYEADLNIGDFAICDPFLIHRTTKKKPGLRLSIDFRFFPNVTIPSDEITTKDRLESYLLIDEWGRCGKDLLLMTDKKLEFYTGKDETKNKHASDTWVCNLGRADQDG